MKTFTVKIDPLTNQEYWEVYLQGQQILQDPLLNKGASFSYEERLSLGIDGLVRDKISTIEEQLTRTYDAYSRKTDDLEKYIYLQGLQNRNEVLFYALLYRYLKELLPIVYTPTVGTACLELSHIIRQYRGIYISPENIHNIDNIFQSISLPVVYLIVVTDGERILGLGDLGSDGMGIPIGKINLYVGAGGLNPACCLPITLDVGTNNQSLLDDPLYLGVNRKRMDGDEYYDFIEKFVMGVKRNFPAALLQWEDFSKHKAFNLFQRYQNRILSFNDDIQGTGAVTLGALVTAMKKKKRNFKDNNFVIVGAGQAGSGIAFNIMNKLTSEGLTTEEAKRRIFPIDKEGLVMDDMANLEPQMLAFAKSRSEIAGWEFENGNSITLKDTIKNTKASVLIGVTAITNLFNDEILQLMSENDEEPVIFALSNPTSKCECTPEQVYEITKGRGLMATGSPSEAIAGKYGTMIVSQCNNMYLFPGVGLGALISRAPIITKEMFLAASYALSDIVTDEESDMGKLLPDMDNIREVTVKIAKAVGIEARNSGLGRLISDDEYERLIRQAQWKPEYAKFRKG